MNRALPFLLAVLLLLARLQAADTPGAVDLGATLPTVELTDGRILQNVRIVGFGSTAVMARWDGGRGTLAYGLLPEDLRRAAEGKRPAPQAATPAPTQAPQEASQAPAGTFPLTAARAGFTTHLLRHESVGMGAEPPPPGVLELATYPGPLGPMAAYMSPIVRDGKRHPAIVWLIGGTSNSISSVAWESAPPENDQSASGFRRAGIIMVYPSLRGGNKNPGFHERFYGEVDDVIAAGAALARRPDVDPRRIYLGGHSTGATLALLVAESTNEFRAVYALGPVGDMDGYKPEALPFDASNPREKELRSPKLWLASIQVPTFVFEGAEAPSNLFSLRDMSAANRNPRVSFQEVKGGTHFSIIAPLVLQISQEILREGAH